MKQTENKKEPTCQICGSTEQNDMMNAYASLFVCPEHDGYKYMWQLEKLKDSLGYDSKWKVGEVKCDISGEVLSETEMRSVDFYDAHVTKLEYRAVKKWQQSDFAIKWFDYIKEFPEANADLPEDVAKFIEWFKERPIQS